LEQGYRGVELSYIWAITSYIKSQVNDEFIAYYAYAVPSLANPKCRQPYCYLQAVTSNQRCYIVKKNGSALHVASQPASSKKVLQVFRDLVKAIIEAGHSVATATIPLWSKSFVTIYNNDWYISRIPLAEGLRDGSRQLCTVSKCRN
jgi:hypothetical protein